ncbi:MAG TPA: diacylglycerol kinase family protein [Allosphingosinicella sp.]|nr:diacylglycerol kinase family protein [Allosphingosinicella sp.]
MKQGAFGGRCAPVIQLVANPAAGRHCARTVEALAGAFIRSGAQLVRSECGPRQAITIDPKARQVCVVGGDGTARHAAIAVARAGRPVPISLYPAGTVNLLHREAGCALDPDLYATQIVRNPRGRRQYAAALGDSLFLACASAGPDSAAVAALSPALKRRIGRAAYAISFLSVLVKWPRPAIRLCWEGRSLDCEAFYVAKGRYFAGPWSFAPDARLGDPLVHVVALHSASRFAYARFLWTMLRGNRVDRLPGVTAFSCTALSIECAEPVAVQADGDLAAVLPVEIKVIEEPFTFC